MSNKSYFIPPLVPINGNERKYVSKSPPPLEIESFDDFVNNKENIENKENNKETNRRLKFKIKRKKKSLFDPVPPLELLNEEKIDAQPTENNMNNNNEETPTIIFEEEQEEESGDVITGISLLNTSNSEITEPSETTTSAPLTSSGRLLESAEEWYRRPKVTMGGSSGKIMIFRPLRMKCTHCPEAYTKTHDLYAHIRTHQHHTKCPHCGKILTCMATFVYHVRTHTTEKPYYCPCDGCDFKNAVKYNLKVHLACIRHGGKDNLKKYAKVLDLDVCDKSLKKRKDNSVHELGSRRSKKRRKLNTSIPQQTHSSHSSHSSHSYKQEEYDQFAAQLLFSLSAIPPVFDPLAMNNNLFNQHVDNVKHEQILKPEQYYDPLYGYYGYGNNQSSSTSSIWPQGIETNINNNNNQNNANSENILIPKQEPIYSDYGASIASYDPQQQQQQQQQQQHHHHMIGSMPTNIYYTNTGYYLNYDHDHLLYSNNNQNQQKNNNKKIEAPPLPIQFTENKTFTINK